jgi:hypothetical protein
MHYASGPVVAPLSLPAGSVLIGMDGHVFGPKVWTGYWTCDAGAARLGGAPAPPAVGCYAEVAACRNETEQVMAEGSSALNVGPQQMLSTWERLGQSPSGYRGSTMGDGAVARRECRAESMKAGNDVEKSEDGAPGWRGVWSPA